MAHHSFHYAPIKRVLLDDTVMQRHTVRFTQLNASGKFTLQYQPRYISPDSSVTASGNDFFFVHRYPFFIDRAVIVSSERDVPYLAFFLAPQKFFHLYIVTQTCKFMCVCDGEISKCFRSFIFQCNLTQTTEIKHINAIRCVVSVA